MLGREKCRSAYELGRLAASLSHAAGLGTAGAAKAAGIAHVRKGARPAELVDRLMVSALIEARSCERFKLLAEACEERELARLYRGLWTSEHGHYRTFNGLAEQIQERGMVEKRWEQMFEAEAKIMERQPPGARMHSGIAAEGQRD
jgi:tRNA isopentenyl-2-thiomethyl-A-37 hydroxylase MiaE